MPPTGVRKKSHSERSVTDCCKPKLSDVSLKSLKTIPSSKKTPPWPTHNAHSELILFSESVLFAWCHSRELQDVHEYSYLAGLVGPGVVFRESASDEWRISLGDLGTHGVLYIKVDPELAEQGVYVPVQNFGLEDMKLMFVLHEDDVRVKVTEVKSPIDHMIEKNTMKFMPPGAVKAANAADENSLLEGAALACYWRLSTSFLRRLRIYLDVEKGPTDSEFEIIESLIRREFPDITDADLLAIMNKRAFRENQTGTGDLKDLLNLDDVDDLLDSKDIAEIKRKVEEGDNKAETIYRPFARRVAELRQRVNAAAGLPRQQPSGAVLSQTVWHTGRYPARAPAKFSFASNVADCLPPNSKIWRDEKRTRYQTWFGTESLSRSWVLYGSHGALRQGVIFAWQKAAFWDDAVCPIEGLLPPAQAEAAAAAAAAAPIADAPPVP